MCQFAYATVRLIDEAENLFSVTNSGGSSGYLLGTPFLPLWLWLPIPHGSCDRPPDFLSHNPSNTITIHVTKCHNWSCFKYDVGTVTQFNWIRPPCLSIANRYYDCLFCVLFQSWLILYFLGDEMWPELWSCCTRRDQSPSSSLFSTDDGGCQPGAHLSFDNEPLLAASSTSTVLPPLPSTSSAYGIDVGHSVCKPATASSSSSSSSKSGVRQCTPGMYAPIFPGPSNNRPGKRQAKSSRRPNWSIPGGSEIYELKMDSISTIS